ADKEVTDKVQKVVEGEVEDINTAKLIVDVAQVNVAGEVNAARIAITISATATITTEEVTLAKALVELKASKPKVKGVFFIQDPNEYLTTTISSKKSQDKGNAIMVEEPVKPKKKDQVRLDEEVSLKAELVEESSKKAKTEVMEGSSKRAGTKLEQESSKRVGTKLEQESSKKQKIDDDKETAELKQLVKIIPDEEEVAIDAIPLAVKPPSIVDWEIHKEGKKSYYKIIRADGSSKIY
nr:hypothetical protein [Tanacetum cinerariifolium]